MAIKEVRYVTEKEWQKMIQMQKNHQEIWNYLERITKYETRHRIAANIPRNDRGQFVPKAAKDKKIRPEGSRRGRPPKHNKLE